MMEDSQSNEVTEENPPSGLSWSDHRPAPSEEEEDDGVFGTQEV